MGEKVTIILDGKEVSGEKGKTVLEIALDNGLYIPNICYHPNVSPGPGKKGSERVFRGEIEIDGEAEEYEGCGLCVVKINGELKKACIIPAEDGMEVSTDDPSAEEERKRNLAKMLAYHPHVCITCEYRNGCDRVHCMFGYAVEERCCDLFPRCELRFVSEYIGVPDYTPKYVFQNLPVVEEKMYRWNWNLCINCMRCVRGCNEVREANALSFTVADGNAIAGRTGKSDVESDCKFCGVCVEICPTGVPRDLKRRVSNRWRDSIVEKRLPVLKEVLRLDEANVTDVPETAGVFRLYDENMEVVYIKGTENLKEGIMAEIGRAVYFDYEEDEMYTMRESELIQEFLQTHGRMPKLNDEVDDLFDI